MVEYACERTMFRQANWTSGRDLWCYKNESDVLSSSGLTLLTVHRHQERSLWVATVPDVDPSLCMDQRYLHRI